MSKRRKRYLNDPWHTAVHEAGHAVVGRVLGMICGYATIIPNEAEGEAGHTITADPWVIASEWEKRYFEQMKRGLRPLKYRDVGCVFRGRIITYMAGAEAERVLLGGLAIGDGDDRYQIALMAESSSAFSSDEEWERYEPRMRRQARRLIRKHRDKIERVAKALLQRRSLTPDEVDQLILRECAKGKGPMSIRHTGRPPRRHHRPDKNDRLLVDRQQVVEDAPRRRYSGRSPDRDGV